jgi:uncharacterized protein YkwD
MKKRVRPLGRLIVCAGEPGVTPTTPAAVLAPTSTPAFASASTSTLPHTPVPTSPPTATQPPTIAPGLATHTIQPGDTLLGLARQHGVPMAAIQLRNGMGDSTVVQVGQELAIPSPSGWEGASAFWVMHVVQPGETLLGIARAYDLSVGTLQAVNELADADTIRVGQELVLPLDTLAQVVASTPTRTLSPPPSPTPLPTAEAQLASPTAVAASPPSTAAPAAPPPADVAAWPRETVRLINEVRAQHGLAPLVYDETLAQAAQVQANDCAQRGWCSHTGSDGSDIKARILRVGYEPASWAECWAQRKTPQGAVDIWMDEVPPNDPHRRTLLTTWLSEIGVGVAQTTWGYYFIADFGRP